MVYHVVLLGDSIFDNAKYVPGGQPVTAQLKKLLPRGSEVKLLAEDGASVTDGASIPVREQIKRIPSSSSHLVLSAGGNDALGESGRLDDPVGNVTEALRILSTIRTGFQDSVSFNYRANSRVSKASRHLHKTRDEAHRIAANIVATAVWVTVMSTGQRSLRGP